MGFKSKIFYFPVMAVIAATLAGVTLASGANAAESANLKLIVYGSTGRVGSRVVDEALSRGHRVTAVSRDPSRITRKHKNLSAVQGNALEPESVAALVSEHDIVVVSVRGRVDKSKNPEKTVHRMAAGVVVGVLREIGKTAPRLIFVGGAGSLEVEPGVIYAERLPWFMPNSVKQEIEGHILTLEYLRSLNDVRWTYISPAKKFKPGQRTGKYRVGGDKMLLDAKGKSIISMEDYAIALIDEAENGQFVGKRFSVAY